jgi:hypothetical protein
MCCMIMMAPKSENILLERTFVLPWSQFLSTEGGNKIRPASSMYDAIIAGSRLESLLNHLSVQTLTRLQESARPVRFSSVADLQIKSVTVQRME